MYVLYNTPEATNSEPSNEYLLAIYGPMIYKALYVIFLMRANPLQGP